MSIFSHFKANRDQHPDAPAFLIAAGDRSLPISWRTFARDIEAIAWLAQKFVPGATVGLLGENSYEWITTHAAGLFAGNVIVPIETNLSPAEIAERLIFTEARVLIHSALYAQKAHEVEKLVPGLIVGGFGSRKADELMEMARTALEKDDGGVFDHPPRSEEDVSTLVFTSGTTSKPHGAELTLRGIGTFVEFAGKTLSLKSGDRSLMLLPLHHIFGIGSTYAMLAQGVALGICPDFRRIFDAVARFRANYLFLVPALAEILAGKIEQRGDSAEAALGTAVEWILVGGAPLARRTYERLMALGILPIGGYGLTETSSLYSLAPPHDPRPGSAGLSCNGFAGMETAVGDDGMLMIRGPAVLKGYYKETAHTAEAVAANGWLRTGDLGHIDADGYVWITGRASRTIVLSSGKKVAPEELEEKILSIPGVHEVVVSGDGASRELKAEIYAVVSEKTLRRQIVSLNRQLPLHKRINMVVARREPFPRTASGKIRVEQQTSRQIVGTDVAPAVDRQGDVGLRPPGRQDGRLSPGRRSRVQLALVLCATLAFIVVGVNLFNILGARYAVSLPAWLRLALDFLCEMGEILLALIVLSAVFIAYRTRRRTR